MIGYRRMQVQTNLKLALAALLLVTSPGCFWLAVGGAGVAGYEIGKDDRSVGTKIDDAAVTTAVKAKLARDPDVAAIEINVDTYEGVVTLHGSVKTAGAEGRAVQLARSVKGVVSVKSKLVIVSPSAD